MARRIIVTVVALVLALSIIFLFGSMRDDMATKPYTEVSQTDVD